MPSCVGNLFSLSEVQAPFQASGTPTPLTPDQIQNLPIGGDPQARQQLIAVLLSLLKNNIRGQAAANAIWQTLLQVAIKNNFKVTWNTGPST